MFDNFNGNISNIGVIGNNNVFHGDFIQENEIISNSLTDEEWEQVSALFKTQSMNREVADELKKIYHQLEKFSKEKNEKKITNVLKNIGAAARDAIVGAMMQYGLGQIGQRWMR